MLKVTVSGSFHRHMGQIYTAVGAFVDAGVNVLSPSDPRIVDTFGDFPFVASDRLRSVKLVQDRHLQSIAFSDFLWIVSPDGYVGSSVAMEIGAAAASEIPILCASAIADPAMAAQVRVVSGIDEAVRHFRDKPPVTGRVAGLLIDPAATADRAHAILDRYGNAVKRSPSDGREVEYRARQAAAWFTAIMHGTGADVSGDGDPQDTAAEPAPELSPR